MLVVVDLQDCYTKEYSQQRVRFSRLLERLRERVKLAKIEGELVINLLCFCDGDPIPEAEEILSEVPRVGKDGYDGSKDLHRYFKMNKIEPSAIELCGIFANVCVLQTWQGLKELGYEVLPVDREMTLFTPTAKKKVTKYPEGYLR